jgi:hypothetical protein
MIVVGRADAADAAGTAGLVPLPWAGAAARPTSWT